MKIDHSFEEEKHVEFHCQLCDEITPHSVITDDEENKKAVLQCIICEETLNCRPKKNLQKTTGSGKKAAAKIKQLYQTKDGLLDFKKLLAKHDESTVIPYEIAHCFKLGDVINHQFFGIGFVYGTIFPNKIQVLFTVGSKLLICAPSNERVLPRKPVLSQPKKVPPYKPRTSPAWNSWSKTPEERKEHNFDGGDYGSLD